MMRRSATLAAVFSLLLACAALGMAPQTPASQAPASRVALQLNTDEAEAVLAIIEQKAANKPIEEALWARLFSTEPYVRLKKREAGLQRDFTDEDFKAFVLSRALAERGPTLRKTLEAWKKADLESAAVRVLAYLPDKAVIHAKVFPVIKPKDNSFVFELTTDPTIFLYLDPALDEKRFENTIAHELHHIGYASVSGGLETKIAGLPANERTAIGWIGAFGEGFAMLAAAGGPDVHPHQWSNAETRARWDHDMSNFNRDLKDVETFFMDIINGRLKTDEEIEKKGYEFLGVQGPWYTVGYKMAVLVEKRFGRAELITCMLDPRRLLLKYNEAAAERNRANPDKLATWSPELILAIRAQ